MFINYYNHTIWSIKWGNFYCLHSSVFILALAHKISLPVVKLFDLKYESSWDKNRKVPEAPLTKINKSV